MWATIGKWAVKVAVFAFNHRSEVIAAIDAVEAAKQKK